MKKFLSILGVLVVFSSTAFADFVSPNWWEQPLGTNTLRTNPTTLDVEIGGDLTVSGSLNVAGVEVDGDLIVDTDSAEAFLVRKDGDTGDVFTVNTTAAGVTIDADTLDGSTTPLNVKASNGSDIFSVKSDNEAVITDPDGSGHQFRASVSNNSLLLADGINATMILGADFDIGLITSYGGAGQNIGTVKMGRGATGQASMSQNFTIDDVLVKRDIDGGGAVSEDGYLLRMVRDITNVTSEDGGYFALGASGSEVWDVDKNGNLTINAASSDGSDKPLIINAANGNPILEFDSDGKLYIWDEDGSGHYTSIDSTNNTAIQAKGPNADLNLLADRNIRLYPHFATPFGSNIGTVYMGFGGGSALNASANITIDDVVIKRDLDGQSTYSEAGAVLRIDRDITNVTSESGDYLAIGASGSEVFKINAVGAVTSTGNIFAAAFKPDTASSLKLAGREADDASAIGIQFGNTTSLTTSGAKIASFYPDNFSNEKAYIDINGAYGVNATGAGANYLVMNETGGGSTWYLRRTASANRIGFYAVVTDDRVFEFENGGAGNMILQQDGLKRRASSESVADDGTLTMPAGTGTIKAWTDGGNYLEVYVDSDGTVTQLVANGNTAITDSDTNLCIYDGGTSAVIKNRLGSSQTVRFVYEYS